MDAKYKKQNVLPQKELEAFARCFYPYICAYYESEQGKAEFAEYLQKTEQMTSAN